MGYWKNKAMENEERYEWARQFLCEVGALKECENHEGTFFDGKIDVTEAYKIANARITSGKIALEDGETRRELTDLIKAVYDDNSGLSGCPTCEKNFGPN
jgi:hypothetical protein